MIVKSNPLIAALCFAADMIIITLTSHVWVGREKWGMMKGFEITDQSVGIKQSCLHLFPSFCPIFHLKFPFIWKFYFLRLVCVLMRFRRRQCVPSCSSLRRVDEDDVRRRKKNNEELAISNHSARILSQLSQCFTTAMVGPRAWISGIVTLAGIRRNAGDKFLEYTLSPIQEQRLKRLQERVHVQFDQTWPEHQEALKSLWHASFPNIQLKGLISDQWKDMGWQGANPSTDFRGCGFISLENLLFFAKNYPDSFHRLLFKEDGIRATWEYPFAVAGINVTFMLIQLLDLLSVQPRTRPGANFLRLLEEDEEAFDVLFCAAFTMLDAQWIAMHASYMEFNEVLRVTRMQLTRELCLDDVRRIYDLPAYNLLCR